MVDFVVEELKTEFPAELLEKGLERDTAFYTFYGQHQIGVFHLSPLPGCCGAVVSHGSTLDKQYRGGRIGKNFHNLKAEMAKKLGYSLMISTTHLRNFPQVIGSANANWKYIHSFRNKRTGNDLGLGIKEI